MLQLETIQNAYSFHSYDDKSAKLIEPNRDIHSNQSIEDELLEITTTSLIYQELLVCAGFPDSFAEFDQDCIEKLLKYDAEIYLIGTGNTPHFPDKTILKTIAENKLAIDFMDTGAACRTFNILTGEYRKVAVLIFFEHSQDKADKSPDND